MSSLLLEKVNSVSCFVLLNEDKKGLSSQIFSWVVPGPGGQDQLESSHKKFNDYKVNLASIYCIYMYYIVL